MTKALVSGSFDPVTVGHIDVIRRAAQMFDEVHAVIFDNTEKKCAFGIEERKAMLCLSCEDIPNVKVAVSNGLLADYTEQNGITVIVRGVRDSSDTAYEISLATINRGLGNSPDTVFIPSKPELSHISSSYVRNMIKYRQSLYGIIPDKAMKIVMSLLTEITS